MGPDGQSRRVLVITQPAVLPSFPVGRHLALAGLCTAAAGGLVLVGWAADVGAAKSLLPGWRVMVPSTAFAFLCIGLALVVAGVATWPRWLRMALAAALSLAGGVLPVLTVVEYASGVRFGVEAWLGFSFQNQAPYAGRMSPMTAGTLTLLCAAVALAPWPHRRAAHAAALAAGTTLLTSWLSLVALSLDAERLVNRPRFPGMAVTTIALLALSSAVTLGLVTAGRAALRPSEKRLRWPVRTLVAAFIAPPLLKQVQAFVEARGWAEPQLMEATFTLTFAGLVTVGVWRYTLRVFRLIAERQQAFAELEDRVIERTQALASSNDELRLREEELRDADRRKDDFLATLAHELRNPLASIRNAASILSTGRSTPPQRQSAIAIVDRQTAVMQRLIEDLLDVSRITAGKLRITKTTVDLVEVMDLAVATVRPELDAAGHHVTVDLQDRPLLVQGDGPRLSQAFANLLHNACKFTDVGGEITVQVRCPDADVVEATVRDSGIGIPADFVPHLFEKFSQVPSNRDRSHGGLGLGLSLVHAIVTLHGGTVAAMSRGTGTGSAFVVRLPRAHAGATPAAAALPPIVSVTARRVLVVDDNEDSATSLATLLRMDGHLVRQAHDGNLALDVAERFRPDVILLDLGMPGRDGFDVCRQVRRSAWGASVMLIAQTGWGQEQDRRETRAAGFDFHLTKPIDQRELQTLLAQTVRPPAPTA